DTEKLRLDDPVKKYLPWFDIKTEFNEDPEITIWHLLTHTSGLPAEAAFPYWTDHEFPSMKQIIETLPDQEMIYPTGTKWNYSNLAMSLLGYIIEAASGQKYEDYIELNILKPLAMNNTCVDILKNKKLKRELATAYSRHLPDGRHKLMPFTDSKGLTPAANMSSTVEDLAKWASFQFSGKSSEGKVLLKQSTLREMQRVQWLQPSWESGWGLGWGVRIKGARTIVGHGGWVAGYRTQISFCPDEKTAFIIMFNADDASPSEYIYKAFDLIAPALVETYGKKEKAEVVIDPEWKKYVGKYQDPWLWDYDVMVLNGKLVIYSYDYPPEEDPNYGISELTPIGKHTFRIADKNGHGQKVIFEFDENGKVTRFKKGENYNYRVMDE
ncbi:MAG: serine hydrolase, partial [Candidatus Marinimicrobia bacterium]|nr:serine hydrolase [Candidatus Neomarinimicrobiota bacterium]